MDAWGKVTGTTAFPGDLNPPNVAAMKVLFAGRPHAIVRRIDTSAAEALPGVLAVLTARDVPVNEYGLILPDQPVLCGPGSSRPYADRVRFVGDQVALVIAETEALAAEGTRRIALAQRRLFTLVAKHRVSFLKIQNTVYVKYRCPANSRPVFVRNIRSIICRFLSRGRVA